MEELLSVKRMSVMTAEQDQRLHSATERTQPINVWTDPPAAGDSFALLHCSVIVKFPRRLEFLSEIYKTAVQRTYRDGGLGFCFTEKWAFDVGAIYAVKNRPLTLIRRCLLVQTPKNL
jgi:hypothetical protein